MSGRYYLLLDGRASPDGGEQQTGFERDPDRWRVVRDGFAPLALAFPTLWLLWHRLWWHAAASLGVQAAAYLAAGFDGQNQFLVPLVSFAVGLVVAIEGKQWVAVSRETSGFRIMGALTATSRDDAEAQLAVIATEALALSSAPEADGATIPNAQMVGR